MVERSFLGITAMRGLKPTKPHAEAGILIEPPISEPVARVEQPAAKDAPDPPEDPPRSKI